MKLRDKKFEFFVEVPFSCAYHVARKNIYYFRLYFYTKDPLTGTCGVPALAFEIVR